MDSQQIVVSDKAYATLAQVQEAEEPKFGCKRPYKAIASEAIVAYAQRVIAEAEREKAGLSSASDNAEYVARRLLETSKGDKDKAVAEIEPDWPRWFKDRIEMLIREAE